MKSFDEWFKDNSMERRLVNYDTLALGYNGAIEEAKKCEQSYINDIESILNEDIHFNGYSLTVRELIEGKDENTNSL